MTGMSSKKGFFMESKKERPTREQVARRTLDRLKKFTDHLESGRLVSEVYSCRKVMLDIEMQPYTAAMVKAGLFDSDRTA